MSGTMNDYLYLPIDAENEIRVLQLQPGAFSDSLVAKFISRKLRDSPGALYTDYDCVSYCWGPQENFRSIRCNDQDLRITAVVDTMLRHLRKPMKPRNLWVDAICINQSDNIEKGKQVSAMGKIYKTANKVHVWLGTAVEEDQIPLVFGAIKERALNFESFLSSQDVELARLSDIEAIYTSLFLSRAWFSRRWILQEVALGHTITIHCGPYKLSWDWFHDAVSLLHFAYARGRNAQVDTQLATEAVHALEISSTLREVRRGISGQVTDDPQKEVTNFLQFLWIYHSSKCMDERDRLYALFGMIPVSRKEKIPEFHLQTAVPIEYSTHFSITYTRFAVEAANHGLASEVLHHAIAFGNLSEQNPAWPSWVPAWNNPRRSRLPTEIMKGRFSMNIMSQLKPTALRLMGFFHPITKFQRGDVSYGIDGSVLAWLGHMLQKPQSSDLRVLVALVLTRAIDYARRFYDRRDFNFDEVFGSSVTSEDSQSSSQMMDHFCMAFQKEFGVDLSGRGAEELEYEKLRLSQEVDRVLEGCEPFWYDLGGRALPGVAFSRLESGDHVFRPHMDTEHKMYFAFIIRPRYTVDNEVPRSFNLVGACVDSQPWLDELKVRRKREVFRELVSHSRPREVWLL